MIKKGEKKGKKENNIKDDYILKAQNISKSYGDKKIISDLNMEVKKGEICALLGENRAAKTPLFKILLNISSKYNGKIEIMGSKNTSSKLKEKISYLGENYDLYSFLTAREIIELAASLYKDANKEWALNLLQRFNIPLDEKVKNFFFFFKQTVKIIQALINTGDLIILDEATISLDIKMQNEILTIIKDLNNKGKTIIFSSHNLLEVKKLADRVAFIKNGEIVAVKDSSFIAEKSNRIIFVPQKDIDDKDLIIKGVTGVEKNGSKYYIYFNKNEDKIIEYLSNIPYFTLKFDNKDLESIFLKLMGGDE